MGLGNTVRDRLRQLVERLMRPGLRPLDQRTSELARVVEGLERTLAEARQRLEQIAALLERQAGQLEQAVGLVVRRRKHGEELAFWRWLVQTEAGQASLRGPFADVFGRWQRERLRELGRLLGHADDTALDAWCASCHAVEIGPGPYPALAAAPRWRTAVAVDPLARAYVEEGLVPAAAQHVVFVEANGEQLPLASGSADLVILENALDHVNDPGAVLAEARRVLRDGGLLWLLVDLSHHTDAMHPHAFSAAGVQALLTGTGFEIVSQRISDHKSHPQAYGEVRVLARRPTRHHGNPTTHARDASL